MAWSTPKVDWAGVDTVAYTDMNRIEANTVALDTRIDTLETDTAAHAADTTIHKTSATIRGESGTALVIETRTSDPGSPVSGQIWLRTDL